MREEAGHYYLVLTRRVRVREQEVVARSAELIAMTGGKIHGAAIASRCLPNYEAQFVQSFVWTCRGEILLMASSDNASCKLFFSPGQTI